MDTTFFFVLFLKAYAGLYYTFLQLLTDLKNNILFRAYTRGLVRSFWGRGTKKIPKKKQYTCLPAVMFGDIYKNSEQIFFSYGKCVMVPGNVPCLRLDTQCSLTRQRHTMLYFSLWCSSCLRLNYSCNFLPVIGYYTLCWNFPFSIVDFFFVHPYSIILYFSFSLLLA